MLPSSSGCGSGNLFAFFASKRPARPQFACQQSQDIMRQASQIASGGTTDQALIRRALAGDEAAFRAIMQANNRRLYRLARGVLRNDAEAEDAVQEAYLRAFTH